MDELGHLITNGKISRYWMVIYHLPFRWAEKGPKECQKKVDTDVGSGFLQDEGLTCFGFLGLADKSLGNRLIVKQHVWECTGLFIPRLLRYSSRNR